MLNIPVNEILRFGFLFYTVFPACPDFLFRGSFLQRCVDFGLRGGLYRLKAIALLGRRQFNWRQVSGDFFRGCFSGIMEQRSGG